MPNNHFEYVGSTLNKKRSIFKYKYPHSASYYLGFLYPIGKPIKVIPGDTFSLDIAGELRTQPLVGPLMDEIECDVFAFYVPNRIVWEHWKQHLGSTDDVLFDNLQDYDEPSVYYGNVYGYAGTGNNKSGSFYWNQSLACHMGLPYPGTAATTSDAYCPEITALPNRGYNFIWNMNFRNEQLVDPILFSKTDTGLSGQNIQTVQVQYTMCGDTGLVPVANLNNPSGTFTDYGAVIPVARFKNLYTTCLPNPNLGDYGEFDALDGRAALQGIGPTGTGLTSIDFGPINDTNSSGMSIDISLSSTEGTWDNKTIPVGTVGTIPNIPGFNSRFTPLYVDFNDASIVLNKFREGVLLGRYYEMLNRSGSRFDELLLNIWGIRVSAEEIDVPELLIHKRFTIYRNQVIATAESVNGSGQTVNPIGSQGAYIDTIVRDSLFTKSFKEHGYIHILCCLRNGVIRHSQGIEPDWMKLSKLDEYMPPFDGLGDVPRYKKELYWDFNTTRANQNDVVFGYQEYGAEYKSQVGRATGWTDPAVPNSLGYYTLCDKLSAAPSLNASYINSFVMDNDAFARCLTIPSPWVAPQFIADWRITGKAVRAMPVYNIPGVGGVL